MADQRGAIRCKACESGESTVTDSRGGTCDDIDYIRRRRKCLGCGYRFTTYETTTTPHETQEIRMRVVEQIKQAIDGVVVA